MKILLVEDDKASRISIKKLLEELGHEIKECSDGETALIELDTSSFDLIFSDINMPNISGLDLLKTIVNLEPEGRKPVILFTGAGTLDSAIDALRIGAADYLLKPVKAIEIIEAIKRVESKKEQPPNTFNESPSSFRKFKPSSYEESNLLVYSKVMSDIVSKAKMYHYDRDIPVLIQGETGTGKELIARLIHTGGNPVRTPFIDVNCAAITQSLFESELFGYEPGAFTGGRTKGQKGKFDIAQGGSLFLDEIGDLPLEMQVKLLRVIEEREFYRVGGLKKIKLNARLISATNMDLNNSIDKGKFRLDLYHRLKVGEIYIPPLRERKEEIIPLALAFLKKASLRKGKCFSKISREAEKVLLSYDWPGNVREFVNTIEKVVFLNDGEEVLAVHLESSILANRNSLKNDFQIVKTNNQNLDEYIKELLIQTLIRNRGNKTAVAQELGISRGALYRLLERLKIE